MNREDRHGPAHLPPRRDRRRRPRRPVPPPPCSSPGPVSTCSSLDRSRYGADTLSTHALMRGGVIQLHRWGLLDAVIAAGTPAVRRTRFTYADDDVTVTIKPSHGVDALYAPRRTVLDPILVDAAVAAGAQVRYGTTVGGVTRDRHGRVDGVRRPRTADGEPVRHAAGLVVGADGVFSAVARAVDAPVERSGHGRHRRWSTGTGPTSTSTATTGCSAATPRRSDPHQRRAVVRVRRRHAGAHGRRRAGRLAPCRPPSVPGSGRPARRTAAPVRASAGSRACRATSACRGDRVGLWSAMPATGRTPSAPTV